MTVLTGASIKPDQAIQESLDSTLQHIALLQEKQDHLRNAQAKAEDQLLHRAATAYAAGRLGEIELADLYVAYSVTALSGYEIRWNQLIPIHAKRMQHILRNAPNGPHGTWHGTYPLNGSPVPLDGISVVYVLYDRENRPCYVGSTYKMRDRLKCHSRDKRFAAWTAYRCADREAAYELEERLLAEHQPYLNKKKYR